MDTEIIEKVKDNVPPAAVLTASTAQRLRYFRTISGLSQKNIADKIGVSQAAVNAWEVGKSSPSFNNLYQLMKVYEVNPYFLVDEDTWQKMKKKFGLRLGFSVEDMEDYRTMAMYSFDNHDIPLPLKISLEKLNSDGLAAVVQYAEDLTYNPRYTNKEEV